MTIVVVDVDLIGLGRSTELYRREEYDEEMRSKYVDPVENFPDKMDQLLDALNRVSSFILFSPCRPHGLFRLSRFTWISRIIKPIQKTERQLLSLLCM
jgi:hypothetical protein